MTDDVGEFLARAGWGSADRAPLAGDASNRSYDRLRMDGRAAVLMVAPPEKGEDVRPFARITDLLRGFGLSAPAIYARDDDRGLLLIEDLGDDLMARLAGDPVLEDRMYRTAVDVLIDLRDRDVPQDIPPYDAATYLREARLVTDWYIPAVTGTPCSRDTLSDFEALVAEACAACAQDVLVLRDYHSENLLWLPDRTGVARVGLLDYQDALSGDAAYDLVSLLEDARRDTSADLRAEMIRHYLDRSGTNHAEFMTAYNALGAQRNLKIMGIFARLCVRDGKAQYPDLIPRVWDHLQRDLQHPSLARLADWVSANVPPPDTAALTRIKAARHDG